MGRSRRRNLTWEDEPPVRGRARCPQRAGVRSFLKMSGWGQPALPTLAFATSFAWPVCPQKIEHGALAVFALQEQLRQSARELVGHFVDGFELAGAGRALDFEIVAVVVVKFLQRLDKQIIQRHPDRPAPVRVAAKQTRV